METSQRTYVPLTRKETNRLHQTIGPYHLLVLPQNHLSILCTAMLGKTCRNGVLTDYQHGFSSKRSTETQLVYTIHDIASANQSNKTIYDAILDFSRAFEKVPHRRLLTKVDYYEIRGPLFNWFESFLTQRTQSVVIEGGIICSCGHDIRVPQGTVLGPLLFLMFFTLCKSVGYVFESRFSAEKI